MLKTNKKDVVRPEATVLGNLASDCCLGPICPVMFLTVSDSTQLDQKSAKADGVGSDFSQSIMIQL